MATSTNNAFNYVQQTSITATPGELLVMLWNAEIKNIKLAILAINKNDMSEAHNKIIKAQEIIGELIYSLDDRYEISAELERMYSFIRSELVQANMKKDVKILENILPLVTEFRDTWEEANKLSRISK